MSKHTAPILELESLKDSTYYYWIGRIGKLYQLCIWAAWYKAKREGVSITLEAVFGECGFAGYVYRDMRTDEMIVGFESPGDGYEFYGQIYNGSRSTSEIRSGSKLVDGIALTGLSVHKVLSDQLGDATLRELLRYLPWFGKFKGEALPFNERAEAAVQREQIAETSGSTGQSLRDSYKPRHRFILDDSDVVRAELQIVMDLKAVRSAINALEKRAAMIPERHRTQPVLVDQAVRP